MNPVGREEDSFISYLGYLARSKVRNVYSVWKFVDDKTKDLIWTQILPGTKDDGGRAAANEGSFPIRSFHRYPAPASSSSQKWKAARMKGDKYINEDVAAVASKIDSLEQQSSQGSFTPVHTRQTFCRRRLGSRITPMPFEGRRGE
ncbi:hypothetical protein K1719_024460 [Acacia pycnantha]|nr:hypothetical protein K1719_024460 [Acacia pycnantha]